MLQGKGRKIEIYSSENGRGWRERWWVVKWFGTNEKRGQGWGGEKNRGPLQGIEKKMVREKI